MGNSFATGQSCVFFFFFQAEDGIRDFCLSRGLGDVYKRQMQTISEYRTGAGSAPLISSGYSKINLFGEEMVTSCGVAALALRTLRDAGIEVVLITTSDLDISLLVRRENEDSALNVLRQAFAA